MFEKENERSDIAERWGGEKSGLSTLFANMHMIKAFTEHIFNLSYNEDGDNNDDDDENTKFNAYQHAAGSHKVSRRKNAKISREEVEPVFDTDKPIQENRETKVATITILKTMAHKHYANIFLIAVTYLCLTNIRVHCQAPSTFSYGQFYPTKSTTDASQSEVLQCRSIRDVIKRGTARFLKVLVRNDNPQIDFAANEDNKYMTSRAKSKLDVLASRAQSNWGSGVKLRVIKAWTDVVDKNDMLSLHYEGDMICGDNDVNYDGWDNGGDGGGRTLKIQVSDGDRNKLGQLCGLAAKSGFDWIYYQNRDFIRVSVIPDVCQTKLDMAFVIDTSGSVGYTNFQTVQRFLKDLVDFYNIGTDQTAIGLISYSYSVYKEFYLNSYSTKSAIKSAIDRMKYEGSMTATGDALLHMKSFIFNTNYGMRSDKSIPKAAKTVLILKREEDLERAKDIFKNIDIKITTDGQRHLGAVLGSNDFKVSFVQSRVEKWVQDVEKLAEFAVEEPQAALSAFTKGLCHRWTYLQRTVPDTSELFEPLEKAISTKLIPAILGRDISDIERRLIALPLRMGGLGIRDPQETADREFQSSVAITKELKNKICEQTQDITTIDWDKVKQAKENMVTNRNLYLKDEQQDILESLTDQQARYVKAATEKGASAWLSALPLKKYGYALNKREFRDAIRLRYGNNIPDMPRFCACGKRNSVDHTLDCKLGGYVHMRHNAVRDTEANIMKEVASDVKIEPLLLPVSDAVPLANGTNRAENARLDVSAKGIHSAQKVTFFDVRIANPNNVSNGEKTLVEIYSSHEKEKMKSYNDRVLQVEKGAFVPLVYTTSGGMGPQCEAVHKRLASMIAEHRNEKYAEVLKHLRTRIRFALLRSILTAIGILLTDGRSNHGTSVYSAAQQVKQAGINMFVIGVGSNLRTSELNDVASDPDSEHVFKLSGFRDLSDFVDQMSTTSCDEGAQLSKCESAETAVDGGSFKYFRGSFSGNTVNVTIEVVDKEGRSYLYTSLVNKNPGPLDPDSDTQKNKNDISPRALSVTLSSTKLLYISVQGQEDKNSFLLNIWDSLFTSDEYKETVLENQAAGQHVATITSHLTGYTFLYSIKYGNGAGHFTINQNTGKVTTTRQLNRESVAKYSLVIVAQDANLKCHKGRTLLTVTVGDLNDNAPSFIGDPYSFRVREDSSPNSYIGTVRATDADAGSNGKLRYSLSSGTGKDDFTLDRDTGVLRVARYLDYDQRQKKYDLQILVQDTGSPVKTDVAVLVINIININEPPTFTGDCALFGGCSVSINEGNTVGRVVKTLTATDPDTTLQCTLQYEIVSSDKHYFNINPTTGLITTSKPIDRELKEVYLLIVDVKDCSDPPLKDRTTVTVTALDINDNAPAFPVSRYSATVLENQSQGTVVVTVSATDVDFGTNSQIAYTIESGNTGGDFSINSVSGLVTTARALDRESVAKFTLTVCASDAGQPIQKICVPLDVSVDDINDNAPTFQGQKTFMVTENVARGTHVGTVQTADRDIGINANIRCSITDGNTNNAFSMDASTCAITTAGVIDRESIASYSLRIKIADLGQPSLSATTRYVISVRDVNDNSPVFTMGTYWATVLENANTNTHVTKVAATDKDQGTNSNIKYTIQSGDDAVPKFAIDRNTGNITLIGALSFGVRNSYRLKVKAEDSASSPRFGTADVVITVQDTNDFSPVFRPTTYSKDIAEGSAIGTVVVDVNATDQDTGPSGILAYSIESGNTNNAFMIVSHTGEIKINRELDYEGIKLYNLGVKASDSGSPAKHASATVRIAVTDINDNAPAFTSTSFSMSAFENATNGHVIGKVTANDYDSGSNSRLTFESTTTGIPFTVDSNGDVKVSSVLDFERTKKYTINVKVSDAGSPVLSATSQVVVSIIDVNDNTPVFTGAPYTCEILENSPSGSAVCYVVATDADAGVNAQLEYMISEGPFNGCPFSVDSSTGQIKTQQYLNREARASYKCQVTATDFGKPSRSSSSNVTINVKDDNDNTPIANPASYTFHIQEEQNTNLTVGRVLATDADQGDNSKLTYSLEGVVGSQHFSINAATGVISALAKLDRETGSSYAMSVKVSDNGIPSLFVNVPVAIIVDDINDNGPVFSKAVYSGRVREDSAIGSNVIQVSATDADAGSNAVITYEITGGAHGGNFSIDANTGLIVTKMALDYETLASYELTVTAKDSGVPQKTSTCKAAITIVNVDDNAPEFGKITEAKVSEGVQTGTPVVKFNATDKDGSVLTYSITQGNTGNAFEIDGSTGQLRVKNPLDRETVPNYNLTVAVTDASSKVTTTHLPIKVLDINDNTPQFQKAAYSQSVNENGATVMSVTRVRALDNDEGTNAAIEYVIESGATKDQFRIQPNGDIETTQVLDRETTAIHTLVVAAKDGGTPSLKSTVVVTVTVKDKNDNAPVFDQVVPKQITENCGDAATVTVVRATDKDAGTYGSVSYKLISENGATGSSAFGIGTSSGAVYTRINLDREATSFYTLVIEANDNPEFTAKKTSRAVLNVTVLDENDNSPRLVSPLLIAPVSEDASVGTLVAKFQATDDDIGVNAEVTFEIVAGNLNDAFVLNASSGELRLAKAIDREQTASYQLKVRVQDKGNPVLRSAKSFGVTVKDVNDNGPAFVKTVFKGTVDENVATGTPVLIVSATDADEGTNSQITYQLDTTAPATAFSINATTGQIFTASALDYEATKSYKFTAIVSDGKFQSSTDVEIEIGNLNDNSPVFDKAYNVNVSEGSAVSSAVLTVVATDKDSFGALTYSLLNSTAFFSIDSQSGQIRTTVGLDRETKSVYFVGVRASDGGSPQLSAQTTVTISVTDVNDNAPYFALSSASVSVSENKLVQSFYTASATDQDAGVNAQIEYSIENGPSSSNSPSNH
eukprot:gene6323-7047_t